jgi:uncharacterized membrane protein YjgN (DUF898 family)
MDISETMRRFIANEQLKKQIKVFLGIGCLGILLVCGLIIWAGVATVKHVATIGENVNVQEQVQNLKKTGTLNLPAIAKVGCWEKAQSLLVVQVWLEKPVAENIQGLMDACLGSEGKSEAK